MAEQPRLPPSDPLASGDAHDPLSLNYQQADDALIQLLMARGLSLTEAKTFLERLYAYGAPASSNVEDRRGDPKNAYLAMLAGNQRIRELARSDYEDIIMRHLRDLDFPTLAPRPPRQSGQLPKDLGLYDIGRPPPAGG